MTLEVQQMDDQALRGLIAEAAGLLASRYGGGLDVDRMLRSIGDRLCGRQRLHGPELARRIVAEVLAEHDVTIDELLGAARTRRITDARKAACRRLYLERWQSGARKFSTVKIGHLLGLDHSTVVHHLHEDRSRGHR